VYPVVPKGTLMLRIIPTAAHTLDEVNYTLDCFDKVQKKLKNGEYSINP
jgi:glycine C-acetyltransferase